MNLTRLILFALPTLLLLGLPLLLGADGLLVSLLGLLALAVLLRDVITGAENTTHSMR